MSDSSTLHFFVETRVRLIDIAPSLPVEWHSTTTARLKAIAGVERLRG
ncbi:hypothetical protein [Chthonomonas calidirosea]|nr:hypothetical protein [Chthonomonas calidirosea]